MYGLADITGAIILNQADKSSIGKWNETRINLDKTNNSALSVIGLAVTYYTELAAAIGLDLGALGANEDMMNASLIWYICGQFKKRDIEDMPKDQCTPEDYRLRAIFYNRACEFLTKVSPAMASLADFCAYEESLNIDPEIFSVSGATIECGEVVDMEIE